MIRDADVLSPRRKLSSLGKLEAGGIIFVDSRGSNAGWGASNFDKSLGMGVISNVGSPGKKQSS
jgi:hypothetical protein